jgi:hypothetical protein
MSNFKKKYPEFAAIEHHIRRAHAERAAMIGTWLAQAIVDGARGLRGLFAGPDAPVRRGPGRKLVVRASVTR